MKVLQVITLVAVIGLAIAFFTMERPENVGAKQAAPSPSDARIAALEKSVADLTASMRAMQERADRVAEPAVRISQSEIDMAVVRALEAREAERAFDESVTGGSASKKAASPAAATFDLKGALGVLLDPHTTWNEAESIWAKIRASGKIDEALEAFEARAEENPHNAEIQAQLGDAYIQKLLAVPEGPERGTFAIKADGAFDKALAIDESNWNARFSKAVSYSFWPAMFGKQPEAIKHFEVLIKQQEVASPQPHFAQTYLFLGNIYAQQGKMDKSQEAWSKGLVAFPGNKPLQEKLKGLESK